MSARFVIDTNVLVSALLQPHSTPACSVSAALNVGIVLYSTATLDELRDVLYRPKFRRFILLQEVVKFVDDFSYAGMPIDTSAHQITICRDPKDNKFLELALAGNATALVTGDADLLNLHPFHHIPILTPATFLEMSHL